jgi:hypothetical protein
MRFVAAKTRNKYLSKKAWGANATTPCSDERFSRIYWHVTSESLEFSHPGRSELSLTDEERTDAKIGKNGVQRTSRKSHSIQNMRYDKQCSSNGSFTFYCFRFRRTLRASSRAGVATLTVRKYCRDRMKCNGWHYHSSTRFRRIYVRFLNKLLCTTFPPYHQLPSKQLTVNRFPFLSVAIKYGLKHNRPLWVAVQGLIRPTPYTSMVSE